MAKFNKPGYKSQPLPASNEAGTLGGILQKSKNPNREKRPNSVRTGVISNEAFREIANRQVDKKSGKLTSPSYLTSEHGSPRHNA